MCFPLNLVEVFWDPTDGGTRSRGAVLFGTIIATITRAMGEPGSTLRLWCALRWERGHH